MTSYDLQYNQIIKNILENGEVDEPSVVRARWEDGSPATTISLLNQSIEIKGDESGLMTTKFVAPKNPMREIRWIWQYKSNVVQKLRDLGCNVWNEWELKDGTIGKAYGYQLQEKKRKMLVDTLMLEMLNNRELSHPTTVKDYKVIDFMVIEFIQRDIKVGDCIMLDQVDWLLYNLKHPTRKYSRRLVITLWCVEDLDDMALEPCVYETHWMVKGNKLHVTVTARSNDMALGNPYNVFQYRTLQRMIAQVSNLELGDMKLIIDDCHVYERHIEGLKEQIERPVKQECSVTLNSNIKSFYDFKEEDIVVLGYDYSDKSRYEVAI